MNITRYAVIAVAVLLSAAAAPRQGPEVNSVMREKLVHSQKVLEAVVTSDWPGLESQAREMERLIQDPRWTVFRYPEYATYSAAFARSVQDLQRAAARRDLEQAPAAYAAMTLQCVACHRYLARARIAR